jgi:hypothetical protein
MSELERVYREDDDGNWGWSTEVETGGGGSLPTGWTQDAANPANVQTNGGDLTALNGILAAGDLAAEFVGLSPVGVDGQDADTFTTFHLGGDGISSFPSGGNSAFKAVGSRGGTVAFDAGGLEITNVGAFDDSMAWVTSQAMSPVGPYQTPLVYDTTAVTGGCYAWDGATYVKISNVVA